MRRPAAKRATTSGGTASVPHSIDTPAGSSASAGNIVSTDGGNARCVTPWAAM